MYRNRILNGQSISRHAPIELWFIRKVSDLRGTKKFANSCRATSDGVQRRNLTFVDSERRRKAGGNEGTKDGYGEIESTRDSWFVNLKSVEFAISGNRMPW